MIHPAEFFRSVELIWLLWFVSCLVLALLTRRLLQGFRWRRLRALAVREEGIAYSLVYVMTVPLYMFFVCLVIESSLILIAKMGSVYAAYAGARSAIVWQSAQPKTPIPIGGQTVELRVFQAVCQAMAPFASGNALHAGGGPTPPGDQAELFNRAYHTYNSSGPGSDGYIQRKYLYAWKATQMTISPDLASSKWNSNLTVTLTYQVPLQIPGMRRMIPGTTQVGKYFVLPITSVATLQNEGPKPEDIEDPAKKDLPTSLGIDYQSLIED